MITFQVKEKQYKVDKILHMLQARKEWKKPLNFVNMI